MTEIMAPAGSYEALMAGINAGADSVYFGVEQLNMRSRNVNFTIEDVSKIAKICKDNNVKSYLTLNTIVYDHDLNLIKKLCDTAKAANVSAVIVMDMATIQYAHSIGLEIHMSTQVNITNIEAVKFYSHFADVVVLARELTLKQIKDMCVEIKKQDVRGPKGELVQVEIFVHGALCVAVSGKCYMSLGTYNSSANRGACNQNCRRQYKVTDIETGDELVLDNQFIMSPKDLCTIGSIDKIMDSGVSVLKIEGRGKGPDYVDKTTKAYKEAVIAVNDNTFNQDKIQNWIKELDSVYNRGFWHGGYYLGKETGEWSGVYGSKATQEKFLAGMVTNFYPKINVAECKLDARNLSIGEKIMITGPTTGIIETSIKELRTDDGKCQTADQGMVVSFLVPEKVRLNDKLFVVVAR